MKTHTLNGIPYSVSDSGDVYMYDTDIIIGRISSDKKSIMFLDNWRDHVSSYLNSYRGGLKGKTAAMMERARGQYKQPK
jgi:hypothetical protein